MDEYQKYFKPQFKTQFLRNVLRRRMAFLFSKQFQDRRHARLAFLVKDSSRTRKIRGSHGNEINYQYFPMLLYYQIFKGRIVVDKLISPSLFLSNKICLLFKTYIHMNLIHLKPNFKYTTLFLFVLKYAGLFIPFMIFFNLKRKEFRRQIANAETAIYRSHIYNNQLLYHNEFRTQQ